MKRGKKGKRKETEEMDKGRAVSVVNRNGKGSYSSEGK